MEASMTRRLIGMVIGFGVGFALVPVFSKSLFGGKGLKSAPEPVLVAGEKRVAPAGKGFSMTLPKGWVLVDPSSAEFQSAIKETISASPALAEIAKKADLSRFAAYAIETRSVNEPLPRTVNVIRNPTGNALRDPAKAAAQLGDELLKQLPGARVLETSAVSLPVGEVPRIVSSLPLPNPNGGTQPSTTVSYVFSDEGRSFNLTVTGTAPDRSDVVKLADRVAGSFRLKD